MRLANVLFAFRLHHTHSILLSRSHEYMIKYPLCFTLLSLLCFAPFVDRCCSHGYCPVTSYFHVLNVLLIIHFKIRVYPTESYFGLLITYTQHYYLLLGQSTIRTISITARKKTKSPFVRPRLVLMDIQCRIMKRESKKRGPSGDISTDPPTNTFGMLEREVNI
ncbi:uncharacterized protein P884DRAFT_118809 [Thermothelomyces heterothallicus CBS 202.75]|uniref:uncharacterized protein n=1 Tax=Thermothelomyces heterothallicus CBS 202.75 TaxID=1149848 RepID=UPI003742F6F7